MLAACALQACCFRSCEPGAAGDATAANAASAGTLRIADWGPRATRAGIPFNPQHGVRAALWIRMDRPLGGESVLVQFGDAFLEGQASGALITAVVPPESYAHPGSYDVRVVARSRDARRDSNKVVFTVE